MDKLEKYVINHSSCGMPRCEYVENGTDIDCDDCQRIMLAEHDAKVIAETLDLLKGIILDLDRCNHYDMYNELMYQSVKVDDVIEVIEQMKEQKE